MNKPANGMQMFHEQVKDREKWHKAVEERKQLIARAKSKGIRLTNPHNMKMIDLKNLIEAAERMHEKHRH